MKNKLKNVSAIITGYTFRDSLRNFSSGNIHILQARDVGDTILSTDHLPAISQLPGKTNAFLETDDVIFSARNKFRAAVVKPTTPTVASSSVFVIRPDKRVIDSNFLAIYLNSRGCQLTLGKLAKGSSLKSILKTDLEQLEIFLPSLKKQRTISSLFENVNRQKKLLNQKIEITERLAEASLINNIKN